MKEQRIKISTDNARSGDPGMIKHEDIYDRVEFGTEAESVESIEKLLSNRPRTFKQIIRETGQTQQQVTKAVAKMVDKGMAIVDNFIEYKEGPNEAQLILIFEKP